MTQEQVLEKNPPEMTLEEKAGDFLAKASQKVQLDIDDAPFLAPEEETKISAPAKKSESDLSTPSPEPKKKLNLSKKKIAFALLFLILLLGTTIFVYIYFFYLPGLKAEPRIIVVPTEEVVTTPPDNVIALDPFWLEVVDTDGNKRFLVSKFSLIVNDKNIETDVNNKLVVVRDAIYYYLNNKDFNFLTDYNNSERIRSEMLNLVNSYFVGGKVDNILYESYLVK